MSAICCSAPFDFTSNVRQFHCEPLKSESQWRGRRLATGVSVSVPGPGRPLPDPAGLITRGPPRRSLLVDPSKDYSSPLQVDCSIEYDLPRVAKPPPNSEPLLLIAKPAVVLTPTWRNEFNASCSTPEILTPSSRATFYSAATPNPMAWASALGPVAADYPPMGSLKENGLFPRRFLGGEAGPCPCCHVGFAEGVPKMQGTTPMSTRWTPYPVPAKPINSAALQQQGLRVTKMNSIKHHMVVWRSFEFQNRSMALEKQIKIRI